MKSLKIATIIAGLSLMYSAGCQDPNGTEDIECFTKSGEKKTVSFENRILDWFEEKHNITPEILEKFNYRFLKDANQFIISNLYELDSDFSDINKFDERYSSDDVRSFLEKGKTADFANSFPKETLPKAEYVFKVMNKNIPIDKIPLYKGYAFDDVIENIEAGFIWEFANKYDDRFKESNRALKLNNLGETFTEANSFDKRFNGFDVLTLVEGDVDYKLANQFHKDTDVYDLIKFVKNKRSVKQVNDYYELGEKYGFIFSNGKVEEYLEKDISLKLVEKTLIQVKQESEISFRFDRDDKEELEEKEISLIVANNYHRGFGSEQIIYFHENHKSPNQVNKYAELCKTYDFELSKEKINELIDKKIPFSQTEQKAKESFTKKSLENYF